MVLPEKQYVYALDSFIINDVIYLFSVSGIWVKNHLASSSVFDFNFTAFLWLSNTLPFFPEILKVSMYRLQTFRIFPLSFVLPISQEIHMGKYLYPLFLSPYAYLSFVIYETSHFYAWVSQSSVQDCPHLVIIAQNVRTFHSKFKVLFLEIAGYFLFQKLKFVLYMIIVRCHMHVYLFICACTCVCVWNVYMPVCIYIRSL